MWESRIDVNEVTIFVAELCAISEWERLRKSTKSQKR